MQVIPVMKKQVTPVMSNYISDIDAIVSFLDYYNEDDGLRRFFLRKFSHPEKLYWLDEETDFRVDFLFISSDEAKIFWVNNLKKYSHLYVFAILYHWGKKYSNNNTVKTRYKKFITDYFPKIKENCESFKSNIDTIHPSVIKDLGSAIDYFLWVTEKKSPFLIYYAYKNGIPTEDLYIQYADIFNDSLTKENKPDIINIMEFLSTTDIVVDDVKCLCIYIASLFPELNGDTRKINYIIRNDLSLSMKWDRAHFYLYVFETLQFFESIFSKEETNSSISISFLEEVSSEIVKEQAKLSEVERYRYLTPLTLLKTKRLNKEIIEQSNNVDKHEWRIIAKLYSNDIYVGEEFLQGYSPDNYWTRLPFSRKADLNWSFYKRVQDKSINLRIEFFKVMTSSNYDSYTSPILIESYTWSVNVKKNLWEKLNYSGEPCLSITATIEFRVSENENFIVNNINWNCDKIWTSIDSGYTYGESDPLSLTNYIP